MQPKLRIQSSQGLESSLETTRNSPSLYSYFATLVSPDFSSCFSLLICNIFLTLIMPHIAFDFDVPFFLIVPTSFVFIIEFQSAPRISTKISFMCPSQITRPST